MSLMGKLFVFNFIIFSRGTAFLTLEKIKAFSDLKKERMYGLDDEKFETTLKALLKSVKYSFILRPCQKSLKFLPQKYIKPGRNLLKRFVKAAESLKLVRQIHLTVFSDLLVYRC